MTPSSDPRGLLGAALAAALRDARATTLHHLQLWTTCGLPGGTLPEQREFNPPAWEAGHIAWFQEYWLARNPERASATAADPDCARLPGRLVDADALYHSGRVAHEQRWRLDLPPPDRLRDYLNQTLDDSLMQLAAIDGTDTALYFHRLSLFHEDMHNEAAVYMANHAAHRCGLDLAAFAPPAAERTAGNQARQLQIAAGEVSLGRQPPGFAFDNELPSRRVPVRACAIDSQLIRVIDFLPFIEAAGYREPRWWSAAGWEALHRTPRELPRFHRWRSGALERCCFGHWRALAAEEAMLHVSAHEAEAWCAWAGRRLPSEGEWLQAVRLHPELHWGAAWEWTRDDFLPFPGFVAHPYRDYSQPWFGNHRVLKGASSATHPRMRDPAYRNFYLPERNDILVGFRSVSA